MTIENRQKIKKLLKEGKKIETIIRLLQGDRGIAGKDGRNGTDGLKGRNGKDGTDGKAGLLGTKGKDGTDGRNGKDGLNGKNGLKGAEGKDGENGEKGDKGEKGDPGDRGPRGHGGISGGGTTNHWNRTGTVLSPKNAGDDISLEFGDLVSEQNPDGYGAIRLKGTESDVGIVLGASGYFNIWNVTDSTPNDNVFCVDDSGNTVIHGYLDMNSNQINELTDPTLDQDAATKKYVDDNDFWQRNGINLSPKTITDNVGIGTTTPTGALHIQGDYALPATSGTTFSGVTRMGSSVTNAIMDMGISSSGSVHGWIQPTNKGNLALNYNLVLNPNGGNVGIGTVVPTQPLSVKEKSCMTAIGGFAIKLTNKTGSSTVAGQLIQTDTTTNDSFATSGANSDDTIGIILEAGIADGSEAWVVVSGIADVLMDSGGSARGDRIISSATAGSADVWNTGGAVATHFQEIGHCIETRAGAGLARCVLHFN